MRLPKHTRRVIVSRTMRRSSCYTPLSPDVTADLVARYQAGDSRAGDVLVRQHEPWIRACLKPYLRLRGADVDDMLQEGRIGFLEAIHSYDAERATITTWTAYRIRKRAWAYLRDNRHSIRVSKKVLEKLQRASEGGPAATGYAAEVSGINYAALSLDVLAYRDDVTGTTLLDTIADGRENAEQIIGNAQERAEQRTQIEAALVGLSELQTAAIRMRRLAAVPATAEAVGDAYGVTHQWVVQVEGKALRMMRRRLRAMGVER